jgi:CheY-like chemotaxis protein
MGATPATDRRREDAYNTRISLRFLTKQRNHLSNGACFRPLMGMFQYGANIMSDMPARPKILIVEDEMMIAIMLEDMLDDLGCAVAGTAAKPHEALAIIAAQPIDAAILDVNLNGAHSYDIAAALDERGVPFLFSTGYGSVALDERFRARPVLQKPFRQEELQSILDAMLAR